MARPTKKGCDYFPFDVTFFDDPKVLMIQALFGSKGLHVLIRLLTCIYQFEGYWMSWDEDSQLLFTARHFPGKEKENGGLCVEVVKEALKRGFFDKTVFQNFNVLTSIGIQKRYFEIKKRASNLIIEGDYVLMSKLVPPGIELKWINSPKTEVNETITPINERKNEQSKVNESKENKIYNGVPAVNGTNNKFSLVGEGETDRVTELLDKDIVGALHDYWNTFAADKNENLIPSKVLHNTTRDKINGFLKPYSQLDLADAIKNYGYIIHHTKDFYYTHRYTIDEFFSSKGDKQPPFEKFLGTSQPEINFRRKECQLT